MVLKALGTACTQSNKDASRIVSHVTLCVCLCMSILPPSFSLSVVAMLRVGLLEWQVTPQFDRGGYHEIAL